MTTNKNTKAANRFKVFFITASLIMSLISAGMLHLTEKDKGKLAANTTNLSTSTNLTADANPTPDVIQYQAPPMRPITSSRSS